MARLIRAFVWNANKRGVIGWQLFRKKNTSLKSVKAEKEQRALGYRRLRSNYGLLIGATIFVLLVILALIGPLFTTYGPYDMKVVDRLTPPGAEHWLGTDEFGRDLLTRLLYGARVSISVGLAVALLSSALGLVIGVYATYYKTLDHILMRICDGLIAIPGILLAIALMAALGASAINVITALTIVFTPNIARSFARPRWWYASKPTSRRCMSREQAQRASYGSTSCRIRCLRYWCRLPSYLPKPLYPRPR